MVREFVRFVLRVPCPGQPSYFFPPEVAFLFLSFCMSQVQSLNYLPAVLLHYFFQTCDPLTSCPRTPYFSLLCLCFGCKPKSFLLHLFRSAEFPATDLTPVSTAFGDIPVSPPPFHGPFLCPQFSSPHPKVLSYRSRVPRWLA